MLTMHFVPHSEVGRLPSDLKIRKLLNLVKEDKIVLMQGKLSPEEETNLIEKTMEMVSKEFKGIELCTIYPSNRNMGMFEKLRKGITNMIIGNKDGLTVIGPATIVKEIKRDPGKIYTFTIKDIRRR